MKPGSFKVNSTSIYVVAWIIAQMSVLLASTEIAYTSLGANSIRYAMYAVAGVLLAAKMIMIDKYGAKTLIIILAALLLIGLVSFKALGSTLILHGVFLVSLRSVNLRNLIKADLKLRGVITAILFILAIGGVINNYSDVINESLKYAFGWQHPNNFAYQIIIMIMESLFLLNKKIKRRHIVGIGVVLLVLWKVCASRTTIFAFLLFIIIYLVVENRKFNSNKAFRFLLCSIMPFCALVSWILVWLYSQGNSFAVWINAILTSRLIYSVQFLALYPINLWGNEIYTVSTREHLILGVRSEILDMSYIRLPLEYGIIFFAVFIILYIAIQIFLVKNKQYREASIVFFFSVLGMTSTGLLSPFSNFSMLFITFLMTSGRERMFRNGRKGTLNE